MPGSAVVEVGLVNCGSPPVDLGLCLGAVAGLVELVNDLLVGDRGFKDVYWGGGELGVQVAPPQHGLDLVIKTHATSMQRSWVLIPPSIRFDVLAMGSPSRSRAGLR